MEGRRGKKVGGHGGEKTRGNVGEWGKEGARREVEGLEYIRALEGE